jgi:hypothetical protein
MYYEALQQHSSLFLPTINEERTKYHHIGKIKNVFETFMNPLGNFLTARKKKKEKDRPRQPHQ